MNYNFKWNMNLYHSVITFYYENTRIILKFDAASICSNKLFGTLLNNFIIKINIKMNNENDGIN